MCSQLQYVTRLVWLHEKHTALFAVCRCALSGMGGYWDCVAGNAMLRSNEQWIYFGEWKVCDIFMLNGGVNMVLTGVEYQSSTAFDRD